MIGLNNFVSGRRAKGAFYCHIAVPISEQIVVFSEGDWQQTGQEFEVVLSYKDDVLNLGKITDCQRCLVWKRDGALVPPLMLSEQENGLAKIVVDVCEDMAASDDLEFTASSIECDIIRDNENTPQFMEESKNTPDRPQKKRRNSLNKDDNKTPNGPTNKKLKTTTRVRGNTPKTDKTTDKTPQALEPMTSESPSVTKIKDTKNTKNISPKSGKSDVLKNSDENNPSPKGRKKNGTPKGPKKKLENDALSGAEGNELPKLKEETSKDSPQTTSGNASDGAGKPGRRKKSDVLGEIETNVDSQKNKNTKKSQSDNADEKTDLCEAVKQLCTNKENVNNTVGDMSETLSKKPLVCVEKQKSEDNITSSNDGKGKVATCKELTLRALDRPSGRWGHSLCFVHKNLSILIGGQGEKQQLCKDSVWTLDTETRRWKDIATESDTQKPEYRMGHTATYDPIVRCLYVFGGSKNTRWFHDVHMLDIEEWKWQLVKVNGKAPTRAYHSATLYRHELWIFGGVYPRPDPQPDGCSNEIHIFSPVMESWYSPLVSGEKPIPRSGHSATLLNDQLVVFGGWDAPISYNDLHVLDMSIVEWTQPKFTGTPPSPRSWHASCPLSNNRLVIHGGYNGDFALGDTHVFNLDKLSWTRVSVESAPCARVGHKALCVPYRHDNEEEDEIIIFGGGDNDGAYFDDLHSIYIPFSAGIDHV
ncbi:hypothetical protein DPMN_094858 [Dreissena polymorpha]|uniref:Kelch repeat-containing protein n=1 Tax=Dreissena polymorpha TaxID=45954 RepID=A0A9D4L5F9_DREPO|nr:hypothetical protein DPMN_094858 [Dreissena polymorpha]